MGAPQFERKWPTGFVGIPPNLDLVAENDSAVVGVEFEVHRVSLPTRCGVPPLSMQMESVMSVVRVPWFAEMSRLADDPTVT